MTILGVVALAVSLGFLIAGTRLAFDPAWITVLICGSPLLYHALERLLGHGWISSELLITVAMIACVWIGELFAAGEVAFIMAIGGLLENYVVARAQKGIHNLISIVPSQGRRIVSVDGQEKEEIVPLEEIKVGDILRVLPGERIAIDGRVVHGSTSVDQSIMTGESLPVDKEEGDAVFCGTMNCYGSVDIRATKVSQDSSLQKMIELVKTAEENKAPTQRIVDKWAAWLVPASMLIAVVTYLVTGELVRGITILVVFCPCALVLATPVSIVAGIGQATKFGILIKSGEALERMGKVNCIAFDKTGTLTEGNLTVSGVESFDDRYSPQEILRITASVEARSEHPIAKAVLKYCLGQNLRLPETKNFSMQLGNGVKAELDGQTVYCGKSDYLTANGIELDDRALDLLRVMQGQGQASVLTAVGGKCVGLLSLSDNVRACAKGVVFELERMDVAPVMLTGDNKKAAGYLALQAGITDYRAELLPADKVSAVSSLQREGKSVCMVGDGGNDAPALKTADVGIAMGIMGSDIAVETADIALMGDDISKLPYLKRLSNAVIKSIKVNITLSMAINFVAIILSVLGLLGPISGALVHNVGSVLVVLNAALLYDRKI